MEGPVTGAQCLRFDSCWALSLVTAGPMSVSFMSPPCVRAAPQKQSLRGRAHVCEVTVRPGVQVQSRLIRIPKVPWSLNGITGLVPSIVSGLWARPVAGTGCGLPGTPAGSGSWL